MVSSPHKGQLVQAWYRKGLRNHIPLHGKIGVVQVPCYARKQRNHGVVFDGVFYVVPCGHLRQPPSGAAS